MKVITYVKPTINAGYIKATHEIENGSSETAALRKWTNICIEAMEKGIIVDYQCELVH